MKKYVVGTFAVMLAIGFSAFTTNAKKMVAIYYQEDDGSYVLGQPAGTTTCVSATNPCTVTFNSAHNSSYSSFSALPTGDGRQDDTNNGVWQ